MYPSAMLPTGILIAILCTLSNSHGVVTSLIISILLVLLQQELCSKLESWTSKQKEVVSKLGILQKKKHYPDEIQDYVADYQLHAYRTVSNWFQQRDFDILY